MNPSNPQRPDTIIIEMVSRPSRIDESVPLLPNTAESVLIPLLKRASLDPESWHTIPGYDLAIRFIAPNAPPHATGFEIRAASNADATHRYRYQYRTDTLSCWTHDQVEHPNLSLPTELPTDPETLARLITIVLRTRPETTDPIAAGATRLPDTQYLAPPDSPPHGPISHAVADIVRHIATNWFGGRETAWTRPTRLFYAFLGSVTFFAMQALVILRFEHLLRGSSSDQSGQATPSAPLDDQFFVGPLGTTLLIIPLSVIFAFISAYVDRQHGPVRLYLGGFLLPYLPWSLTVLVTAALSTS